jgi:hypothetical protein
MIKLKSNPAPYEFTKDTASKLIFAEVKHFTEECSIHGPSEDELQTLTRRLSWLVDRDIRWTDVDLLVSYAKELRTIDAGTHPNLRVDAAGTVDNTGHLTDSLMLNMFWEINLTLGDLRPRLELAA